MAGEAKSEASGRKSSVSCMSTVKTTMLKNPMPTAVRASWRPWFSERMSVARNVVP